MRVALFFSLLPISALAFDPFTAINVVSSVGQILNMGSQYVGAMDAFTELYSEANPDAKISDEGEKLVSRVREIHALAEEVGYTAEEASRIGDTQEDVKKLEQSIRTVTKAIRTSKRALGIFKKLDTKAQAAQIESTSIEKEQLAELYKLVRLQQEANLSETKKELLDLVNKKKQITSLRDELRKKGARLFGMTGVLYFPKSETVIETAITVAGKIRGPLIGMILVVFLARLMSYQFGFFGLSRMGELVRDTMICFVLMLAYPEMVRAVVSYSLELAGKIGGSHLKDIEPQQLDLPWSSSILTSTRLMFLYALDWLKYLAFGIIDFVMNFVLSFMVMVFPVVIFVSQMLRFSIALNLFFGTFVIITLWPLCWNLVGLAAEASWNQKEQVLAQTLYSALFTVLQMVSPVLGLKLMQGANPVSTVSDSVRPPPGLSVAKETVVYTKTFFQNLNNKRSNGRGAGGGAQPNHPAPANSNGSGQPKAAKSSGTQLKRGASSP